MNKFLVVVMVYCWFGLMLPVCTCCADELPPLPPKFYRTARQAKGAEKLTAPIRPPAITSILLTWTSTNTLFNVRCLKTNNFARPQYNWPIIATTTNKYFKILFDKNANVVLFGITATNTIIQSESEFAQ